MDSMKSIVREVSRMVAEYQMVAFVTHSFSSPDSDSSVGQIPGQNQIYNQGQGQGQGQGQIKWQWQVPVYAKISMRPLSYDDTTRRFPVLAESLPSDRKVTFFEMTSSIFSIPQPRLIGFIGDGGVFFPKI